MASTARVVSLSVLTTLIIFLGITFYQVVAPFLLPLFLAGVLTILSHPLFKYFARRTNNRIRVAAGLTTATVMLLILVPLLVGIVLAALQLYSVATAPSTTANIIESAQKIRDRWTDDEFDRRIVAWLQPFVQEEIPAEEFHDQRAAIERRVLENAQESLKSLAGRTLGLAGATLDLLGGLFSAALGFLIFGIALYYFLADGPALVAAAESLIPVHADYQRQLIQRFDKVVRAVVLATLVSAIAQGLATAILLYLAGIHHFFIFFIVTTCTAVIPLAGTWVVWGPCAVWLFWQGHWVAATLVVIIGAVVIGTMDNVIKTYVLHSDAKLHPLLAFVSVLGGLQAMGLWGVFIGPIVASCLHALVQIFNVELKELSKERRSKVVKRPKAKPPKKKGKQGSDSAEPADPTSPSETGTATEEPDGEQPPSDAEPRKPRRRRRRRRRRGSRPPQDAAS